MNDFSLTMHPVFSIASFQVILYRLFRHWHTKDSTILESDREKVLHLFGRTFALLFLRSCLASQDGQCTLRATGIDVGGQPLFFAIVFFLVVWIPICFV